MPTDLSPESLLGLAVSILFSIYIINATTARAEKKLAIEANNDNRYFFEYMGYWLKFYVVGVRTIVEGFRDYEGNLLRFEEFETSKIPKICKQRRKSLKRGWNIAKIQDFLEMALTEISNLCRNNPETMVQVKFDAKKRHLTAFLISDCENVKLWKEGLSVLGSHLQRRKDGHSTGSQVGRNSHHVPIDPERGAETQHNFSDNFRQNCNV